MSNETKTVLVTGDVIVDHYLYEGDRTHSGLEGGLGTRLQTGFGGAVLLHRILDQVRQAVPGDSQSFEVKLGIDTSDAALDKFPPGLQSFGVWGPKSQPEKNGGSVWRLINALGYGVPITEPIDLIVNKEALESSAKVIVLDDAGLYFRNSRSKHHWPTVLRGGSQELPDWVVLKLSRPIGKSDLWRTLINSELRDRLIVVLSIEELRAESVRVSRGVSWERTALDLVDEFNLNPSIAALKEPRHCVICIGSEGALHVDRDESINYRLLFDPAYLEGEWQAMVDGDAFGYMSCLVAGIVSRLIMPEKKKQDSQEPQLYEGIIAGLKARRTMLKEGHGDVKTGEPSLPLAKLAKVIVEPEKSEDKKFYSVSVPVLAQDKMDQRSLWTILGGEVEPDSQNVQPLVGIARRVAIDGTDELSLIPHQQFGKLLTVDRTEIESLRNVKLAISRYEKYDKGKKPLSIAVFGAPGSGKSFGVEQIAKGVLGKDVPIKDFNLSQFAGVEELIGAFHQVRDKALGPHTPVIFWDEFDSGNYRWLQYLLAPMQDGAFQEKQITHPIGKCIFIFAGGTSYDFEHFGPRSDDKKAIEEFKRLKGPDFTSRLNLYLNVFGPNKRPFYDEKQDEWKGDQRDICYPIRRALLLRSFLGKKGNQQLSIDDGILTALLEINEYAHGARSMGNVVKQMLESGRVGEMARSDLPPEEVVSMHVDYMEFVRLMNRDQEFARFAEKLAPYIHGFYCEHIKATDGEAVYLEEFEKLPKEIQDDNLAAAMRIPKVLAVAGLYAVPRDDSMKGKPGCLDEHIEKIITDNLDKMAKEEHDSWMETRLANGWRFGEQRKNDEKIHPNLIPYHKLDEEAKSKDKNSILSLKDVLARANYSISNKPST